MKIVLVLIAALLLATSYPAQADGSTEDEWLGIGGLRIVDVHHTEGYIAGMMNLSENGTGWIEPDLSGQISADVAGIWSITLAGDETRRMDLALYQVEGEVFGEGRINSARGSNSVTAAGYATSNMLDLRVVTFGVPALIRLRLSLLTSPIQGSYAAYSASGLTGSGAATGYKTASSGEFLGPVQTQEALPPDIASGFGSGLGAV
ncbi:MAG: hypothetical protein WCY97_06575 [Methanothrix sp.]|jgi:hypothetical protein|uniref:Uncharacterized protein n=1 Tax=Methanothrix harundinacea TaxID=301375 RepID=A0A101IMB8_9EURY|nr:MAG: hypothetical protein APR56_09770 [Methanosaeta sp. SDB]KUK45210.1 MAG: Uncharacterized protein XD72_0459 [Methanothrix harundinacea]MDD2637672.1 hypothetical protein [Methanothrix sp.]MDI9398640.1 hypothetical protein [Euryarchaeota archaeon]KUK97515.1 MAG: Uncharacterized protein XE07_0345 [Methanothrix harundinacea]